MRFTMLAFLGLALLIGCGGEDEGTNTAQSPVTAPVLKAALSAPPIAVSDDLGRLVPADAVVVFHAGSPKALIEGVHGLVAKVDPQVAVGITVDRLMAMMLQQIPGVSPAMVDASRPMAIALSMSREKGAEPIPRLILPLRDVDAARGKVEGAAFSGSYMAFVMAPDGDDPQASSETPAIAKDLPSGGLSVRVDLATLAAKFGDKVKAGFGQAMDMAAQNAPPDQPDMSGLFKSMQDGFGTFLDSVEMLEIGIGIDGGDVTLAGRLNLKEGSPIAGAGTPEGDLAALAAALPAGDPIAMLASFDLETMMKWVRPLMDAVLEALPEDQRTQFASSWDESMALMEHLGDQFAFSMSFEESGIRGVGLYAAKDADAYMDGWDALLDGGYGEMMAGFGMNMVREEATEVAGRKVRRYRMAIDIEKLMAAGGTGGQEMPPEATGMFEKIFGPDGMPMAMAATEGKLVYVIGDEATLTSTLAAAAGTSRQVDAGLARAMKLVGDRPSFVMHLELRALTGQILRILRETMPEATGKLPALGEGPPIPIDFAMGIEGRVWRGALRMDVGGIIDLVKQFMPQAGGPR